MHGAAAAAGAAGFAAEEFGHELFRGKSLCECVSVSTMGTEDAVAVSEVEADTGGDGFLTDVGVAGSVDESLLVAAGEFFFGLADPLHGAVERENLAGHGREPLESAAGAGVRVRRGRWRGRYDIWVCMVTE